MGLIKEYVDRAVQTDADPVPSPYADPAVVLAAPPVTHRGLAHEVRTGGHNSIQVSSPTGFDGAYAVPISPNSPILSPLVSRRLSKRKHARCPVGEIVNRRIVSMPESTSEQTPLLSYGYSKRVVSMPDRVRPELEPSVELFQSPSTAAGDSFGSYSGRRERVRVFRAPSDIPQTPSPPSSPESLLIIAAGTQLPEGFLRRKYSPEPLIEEDEAVRIALDWITWANSPPRPIPALHGPLSLPYARCPSGAEGTIIEEPDNVAQMIWGLGPGDQPHNQNRIEALCSHPDNLQNAPSHGPSQVPPRLQKKRTITTHQVPKSSRTQISAHAGHAKPNLPRTQRQIHDDKCSSQSRVPSEIETHQDIINELPWNDGQSMPTSDGVPDNVANDADMFPGLLEWQLARLRQALRTSLADMDSYSAYPGRLEPVIPTAMAPGLLQSYPRIFVEPRADESINSVTRQSPIEIAQQYRQLQLYRQALQKQKLQIQNILPTPPNSSSPQWSSHFSPYQTYCSTFSPELVGSTEHPVSVPSQKYRSGAAASQYLRHVYDRHEHNNAGNLDTSTSTSFAKTPQNVPNVNSAASLRQSSSSSSTLAKYIKQLQALSPIAHLSPLQPAPPPNVHSSPLSSTDESAVGSSRSVYHSPVVPTPPSPESPQTLSRGSLYHSARSMPPTRPMQRRLSSVPEEDSTLLEPSLATSVSPSRLQSQVRTDSISSSHDGTTGHQTRYLEVPFADVTRKSTIPDMPRFESSLGTPSIAFHHETSPVKVRLPVTKDHNIQKQTSGYHEQSKEGHQHGHRKKHRYKKLKGLSTTNQQEPTCGLVG